MKQSKMTNFGKADVTLTLCDVNVHCCHNFQGSVGGCWEISFHSTGVFDSTDVLSTYKT